MFDGGAASSRVTGSSIHWDWLTVSSCLAGTGMTVAASTRKTVSRISRIDRSNVIYTDSLRPVYHLLNRCGVLSVYV